MADAAGPPPPPPQQGGGDGLLQQDIHSATTSPDAPRLESDFPESPSSQSDNDSPQSSPSSSLDLSSEGSPSGSMAVEDNLVLGKAEIEGDELGEARKPVEGTLCLGKTSEEVPSSKRNFFSMASGGEENSDGESGEEERLSTEESDLPLHVEGIINGEDKESREKQEFGARMEEAIERERELRERLAAYDVRVLELDKERSDQKSVLSEVSTSIRRACDVVSGIVEKLSAENHGEIQSIADEENGDLDFDTETRNLTSGIKFFNGLVAAAETAFLEYEEKKGKEKKELENSVVSLTEEARDIGVLLKVALAEKEALERSLNKLKGGGGEQKRVAILQIAERGLQRVGFGFMMGSAVSEADGHGIVNSGTKGDENESEEQVVSLASTVENMMKNMRLEISELRKSLEEARADNERLQQLTERQALKISENALYIKDLEERENMLTDNVEELMMEITEAEEDIARWREACELEVEAGKNVILECDRETAALREELELTKASLELANNKLKLKEGLAAAAIAAQEAAEKSLQLADTRSAILHERIEELTKQLEAVESKGDSRRVRHMCWPWDVLKVAPGISRRKPNRRRLSDMDGLLHYPA